MDKISKPEVIGPNKDVVEMAKTILRQHGEIIKLNAALLESMALRPLFYMPLDKEEA